MVLIEKILPFAFALLMLSVVLGFSLDYRFFSLLKKKHPKKWKELGQPSLFLSNNIKNNVAVSNFLEKREYIEFNDKQITRIAGFLRIFRRLYMVFFIFLIFLFVTMLYLKRM